MKLSLGLLLTVTLFCLMLAGCKDSEEGSGQTGVNSDANVTAAGTAVHDKEVSGKASDDRPSATIGDGTAGEIKVWVADAVVDFTAGMIRDFFKVNPQYNKYKVLVQSVGEGDAAGNMLTDVEAGVDIYAFAQDQIARLVAAGALETVNPDYLEAVRTGNDEGSVRAATVGNELYAYPLTSDNGYFLFYDKSVVRDPSSLEAVISDCEAAGKNFYMEINSGWYQTAFFFATGCELNFETDDKGNFTDINITYASGEGVTALREMIDVCESKSFQNGSALGEATNVGAIVSGTWDNAIAHEVFGGNYACAKLPSFTDAEGKEYQMSGFGGFKLLGVKPQSDEEKLKVCDALAYYLSSGNVQLKRYRAVGWGPSNLDAKKAPEVITDEALAALSAQLKYTVPQGQYPQDYWTLCAALGDSIRNGELSSYSDDDELMETLVKFEETCETFVE